MELFDHDAHVLELENSYLSTVRFLSERRKFQIKPNISYMQALISFSDAMEYAGTHFLVRCDSQGTDASCQSVSSIRFQTRIAHAGLGPPTAPLSALDAV